MFWIAEIQNDISTDFMKKTVRVIVNFSGHFVLIIDGTVLHHAVIAFFVNLFAAVCYFARTIADATCTPGFLMFTGATNDPDAEQENGAPEPISPPSY